jgi:type I restriction enzyme M protein
MSNGNGSSQIVSKLWNFCQVLRDDGLSYQDYLEQLVTLLFLKMADERAELTGAENPIPAGYRWFNLAAPTMEGALLEEHYRRTLNELGKSGGMLGIIFRKAQNKIQDPAKLRQLIVELIGKETWTSMSSDVKGDAYEGLLEKKCRRHQERSGTVFHTARADQRAGGLHQATPRRSDLRSSLRHRGISALGVSLHRNALRPRSR